MPESTQPAFTQSPEFKAAVALAAKQATECAKREILEELAMQAASAEGSGKGGDSPNFEGLFRQMAMAIAEISDQGTDRKRVSPEILTAREDARKKMFRLISEAADAGQIPAYKLKNKTYLDEVMLDPIWVGTDKLQRATEIDWPGVPNEAMIPINEVAEGIHQAYMDSIGSIVSAVPEGPLKVTAGGLVVHGQPGAARRQVGAEPTGEGLRIRGRGTAGVISETRVLGTVAAPARQTA